MGGWNDKELGRQYEKKSSEHAQEMARRIAAELRGSRLEIALREMVYETTHLSVQEDDGGHKCKISGETLARARAALAG